MSTLLGLVVTSLIPYTWYRLCEVRKFLPWYQRLALCAVCCCLYYQNNLFTLVSSSTFFYVFNSNSFLHFSVLRVNTNQCQFFYAFLSQIPKVNTGQDKHLGFDDFEFCMKYLLLKKFIFLFLFFIVIKTKYLSMEELGMLS